MKFFSCILLAAVAVASAQYYDSKYDSINVDEIISNQRILNQYAQCFLDKKPCTRDAADIKSMFIDSVKTACQRCSPKQIGMISKLNTALKTKHMDLHNQLLAKYDPAGTYRGPFLARIEGH